MFDKYLFERCSVYLFAIISLCMPAAKQQCWTWQFPAVASTAEFRCPLLYRGMHHADVRAHAAVFMAFFCTHTQKAHDFPD
jgi:hypothetical protein